MNGSTIYTIGTALNRAHANHLRVEVLAEGQWLNGLVLAVDGHGVVLSDDDLGHSVIRMESVAAVRVLNAAGAPRTAPAGSTAPETTSTVGTALVAS